MSRNRRRKERATYSCLILCNYPFNVVSIVHSTLVLLYPLMDHLYVMPLIVLIAKIRMRDSLCGSHCGSQHGRG